MRQISQAQKPQENRRSGRNPARLKQRYRTDMLFRRTSKAAVFGVIGLLFALITVIFITAIPAFYERQIKLEVFFDESVIQPSKRSAGNPQTSLNDVDFGRLLTQSLVTDARALGLTHEGRAITVDGPGGRILRQAVSPGSRAQLRERLISDPRVIGKSINVWISVSEIADEFLRAGEKTNALGPLAATWLERKHAGQDMRLKFHLRFFTNGDSRTAETAGLGGAVIGSLLTLFVTACVALPIGLTTAIYLEEFAPENQLTKAVEVNINNLAAIPSIIYGLLGLAVLLNVFHLPRSSPLVGGLTLAVMSLPTIIIASRMSIRAVPVGLRSAALALGANKVQVIFHHVLPIARPGIITGVILAMARALGETAPLLMIGMLAFVVDIPEKFTDAAVALPVQIFLWSDNPKDGFSEKTAGAVIVLLFILFCLNIVAVLLRNRLEKRGAL